MGVRTAAAGHARSLSTLTPPPSISYTTDDTNTHHTHTPRLQLGTHLRGKRKREELAALMRRQRK